MFDRNVTYDLFREGKDLGEEMRDPRWDQVEQMIRALDGSHRTLVTIGLSADVSMMIGGGKDGCFVVCISRGLDEFCNLRSNMPTGEISMVLGGQMVTYPRGKCCNLQDTLIAARVFWDSGAMASGLTWQAG